MYISATLLNQLREYLSEKAARGDEEARALLVQLDQLEPEAAVGQALFAPPPGESLGC
ncbi:MAG: hypothetical protein SW833_20475 [Cyanobacteriota bacterium]|nr:hypothetical protein [Cyanobacteriota bacterium]